jgi:hypothetical protein
MFSITPHLPIALAGRGGGPRVAKGIDKLLEANAIVIADGKLLIALVGLDTLFCSAAFKAAVIEAFRNQTGAELNELFLIASHTHNAPSLDPNKPILGAVDERYFQDTASLVAKCISNASQSALTNITIGHASTTMFGNARRRRKTIHILKQKPFIAYQVGMVPQLRSDVPNDLDLIVARNSSGRAIWCIWRWACHATTFPHSNLISPDFPGEMRSAIRKNLNSEDLPVVFLPGAAGDLGCDVSRRPVAFARRIRTPFARPFADTSENNFQMLAKKLELALEKCALDLRNFVGDQIVEVASVELPLEIIMDSLHERRKIEISKLSIGHLNFLFIGAEVCSPWESILRPYLPSGTMISGYCNDVPCYLPTQQQVEEGGYEAVGFKSSFAIEGQFNLSMQDTIVKAVQSVCVHDYSVGVLQVQ